VIVEKLVCTTLAAVLIDEVWFGVAPQPEANRPIPLPFIIVNRPGSEWLNQFCGVDLNLAITSLQIDYYAGGAEAARRLADQGRAVIAALVDEAGDKLAPAIGIEQGPLWDSDSRAWRIIQPWTVGDYQPAIAP
jgi:hypothetical protein